MEQDGPGWTESGTADMMGSPKILLRMKIPRLTKDGILQIQGAMMEDLMKGMIKRMPVNLKIRTATPIHRLSGPGGHCGNDGREWAMRVPRVEWEETAARCRCFRMADRGFVLPLKETQDAVHAVAVMARTRATAANQRPEPCAGYVALELGKFADDVDALNQLGDI